MSDTFKNGEAVAHGASEIRDSILTGLGIDVDDEIKHYGVKGMKWGQVRERGANGRVGKTTREVSEDYKVSRASKAKKPSEMSNAELKKLNERLQLEKSNRELQSRGALQKIKTGTTIAGTILAIGTTVNTAIQFTNSPAGKALMNAITKKN